jgi:hypothetical protein
MRRLPPSRPEPAPSADPPELALIAAAVAGSATAQLDAWAALLAGAQVQIYTAGAAPEVRGAGAGCAALVEGAGSAAPRLTLSATLPVTEPDPPRRAALAGVLLGQAVLLRLGEAGWSGGVGPLWTTHQAAVSGPASGPPHADLAAALAHQQHLLRWAVPGGLRVAFWPATEGAGVEVASLARAAAFADDVMALARYEALHPLRPAGSAAPAGRPPLESDYTLVLGDRPAVGQLAGTPVYRLWTRDGRSRRGSAPAPAAGRADAAAWASLLAALPDLTARITRRKRDPAAYSLTIYSSHEALGAALRDLAPGPPASARQAQALLRRFGSVRVLWQPAALLAAWLDAA